jgi:hypothetical protein
MGGQAMGSAHTEPCRPGSFQCEGVHERGKRKEKITTRTPPQNGEEAEDKIQK